MTSSNQISQSSKYRRRLCGLGYSCLPKRGRRQVFAALALLLLLIGFLVPLRNEYRAVWLSRLHDTLHAPAFAFVAVCLLLLFGRPLLQTIALAGFLAMLVEVCQASVGRSMSVNDLAYDGLGLAAAFVTLRSRETQGRLFAWCCRVALAITFLLTPLVLESPILIDAWRAAREFPMLSDFSSPGETQRWYHSSITMRRVLDDGKWRAEIRNGESQGYGSAILLPVIGDWSGYERVCCEFSFTGPSLKILISARDGHARIDVSREYAAGTHRVCLNLRDPVTTGDNSRLDLTRVQSFHFAIHGSPYRTAMIHSVQLE